MLSAPWLARRSPDILEYRLSSIETAHRPLLRPDSLQAPADRPNAVGVARDRFRTSLILQVQTVRITASINSAG